MNIENLDIQVGRVIPDDLGRKIFNGKSVLHIDDTRLCFPILSTHIPRLGGTFRGLSKLGTQDITAPLQRAVEEGKIGEYNAVIFHAGRKAHLEAAFRVATVHHVNFGLLLRDRGAIDDGYFEMAAEMQQKLGILSLRKFGEAFYNKLENLLPFVAQVICTDRRNKI